MHGDARGGSEASGLRDACVAHDVGFHGERAASVSCVPEARPHHGPPHGPPLPDPGRVTRTILHYHSAAPHPPVRRGLRALCPPEDHRQRARPLAAATDRRRPRHLDHRHGSRCNRGDEEVEGDS